MIGIARAPGTCGELVQGNVNGVDFLITCPVDMYSTVKVELNDSGVVKTGHGMSKVEQAVVKVLEYLECSHMGAEVHVSSDIPRGKGMASSTADIAAACAATSAALKRYLSPGEIAEIALSIEPTDGLMFQGITMFDHVKGKVCRILGNAPKLEILIVDLGGTVDTVSFNANTELNLLNQSKEHKVKMALEKVVTAFEQTGQAVTSLHRVNHALYCSMIGEAATISAFANQQILFKPELDQLLDICKCFGGVGINIAHSGTVVGLMFETGFDRYSQVYSTLSGHGFNVLNRNRMLNGGVEVLQEGIGDTEWHPLNTFMGETFGKLRKNTG